MSETTSPGTAVGRIAVLGPGGVGGLLAGLLARRGADVTCVAGPTTTAVLARQGICVESRQFGTFSAPVRAVERLDDPVDVCLVIPLLNGVEHLGLLERRYPEAAVVPATIRCESARTAPGGIHHDSPFVTVEMAAVDQSAADVRRVADALDDAGVTVRLSSDAPTVMWGELTFLVALALLTTAAAAPGGRRAAWLAVTPSATVPPWIPRVRGRSPRCRLGHPGSGEFHQRGRPGMTTVDQQTAGAIRPFSVRIAEEALDDLRRRLRATRWPSRELVADRSQGVQLATLEAVCRYWASEYEGRRVESRLNALPQFVTAIDGVDIHFVHVRSRHEDALPLIMTHGWPGSVVEMLDSVGPLTDPTAHGGSAEDAFHLVLPSLPGYGFSGQPAEVGWDLARTARAWAELIHRLGYDRYVAQGGDVGAGVTDRMGRLGPDGLAGIHTNLLVPALDDPAALPADGDAEQAALAAIRTFSTTGNGYFVEMATRPQTIGYALLDSPAALAAWMIDHDTDAYEKISRAFVDDRPSGNLTRDNVLDDVTAYWLTGTGASAARSYWEAYGADSPTAGSAPLPAPTVPVGFSTFPGEIWRTPRSWAEQAYPTLSYFGEAERGGHFAAWEEPELFAAELRAAFRPLRAPELPGPRG